MAKKQKRNTVIVTCSISLQFSEKARKLGLSMSESLKKGLSISFNEVDWGMDFWEKLRSLSEKLTEYAQKCADLEQKINDLEQKKRLKLPQNSPKLPQNSQDSG